MEATAAKFRRLEADKIIETVKELHHRIEERFPGSGLGKVIGELQQVAEETVERTRWIQQPHLLLRCVAVVLSLGIVVLLIFLVSHISKFNFDDFTPAPVEGADQVNSNAQSSPGSSFSCGRGDVRGQSSTAAHFLSLSIDRKEGAMLIWTALYQNFETKHRSQTTIRHPNHHPFFHQSSGGIRCKRRFSLWA